MKKVSLRIRSFDKERYLTYNIDNEACLDEEVIDFIEDEEPNGIVPVIFEEGEEFDTFSYSVTDRIHLSELSNQEVSAEMVLKVLRSLVLTLINMTECRIPLSYLVLHRDYIYVDSDYKIAFICIPIEDLQEDVDLNAFLRGYLANIRYDLSEDCTYVAKLLTYVNNVETFNLHNMVSLIEELMEEKGIEIPEEDSAEIYADYQEVMDEVQRPENEEPEKEFGFAVAQEDISVEFAFAKEEVSSKAGEEKKESAKVDSDAEISEENDNDDAGNAQKEIFGFASEKEETEDSQEEEQSKKSAFSLKEEEVPVPDVSEEEELPEEESMMDDVSQADASESHEEQDEKEDDTKEKTARKPIFKTREANITGVVIEDDLDEFLAEKEREDQMVGHEESNLKIKKNIKINRASIVKNTQDEIRAEEEVEKEQQSVEEPKTEEKVDEEEDEEVVSTSILSQTLGATGLLKGSSVPKANPYLIRTNTKERIMITKQNFKIGKASMGVDYTVKGNGAVSRTHAVITNKDGVYYIKDNKSTNHTYVNNKLVEDGESELLTHDCKIVLGDEEFTFKLR